MRKIENLKRTKIHGFMDKATFFLGTLSISPWALFATWLHLGALQENTKK
jgi:hypothetical protein